MLKKIPQLENCGLTYDTTQQRTTMILYIHACYALLYNYF